MRLLPLVCLSVSLLSAQLQAQNPIVPEFTLPQLLENNNPPVTFIPVGRFGKEKWVYLNVKVDKQGRLHNQKVLRHNGDLEFVQDTLDYLNQVTFAPATLNERTVEGHLYVLMTESIPMRNGSNTAVSRGFRTRFIELQENIESKEKQRSYELIESLDERNKRTSETAWLSWMKAAYHHQNGDMDAYYRDTEIAVLLAEKSLPPSLTARVLMDLFEYQINNHLLADAFKTVEKMQQSPKIIISDERVRIFHSWINESRNQRQPFSIEHTLPGDETFYHNAYSDNVEVRLISGEITDAQMRCIGESYDADITELNHHKSWIFANNYPQCAIFVSGTPGSQIQIRGSWQDGSENLWVVRDDIAWFNQSLVKHFWRNRYF